MTDRRYTIEVNTPTRRIWRAENLTKPEARYLLQRAHELRTTTAWPLYIEAWDTYGAHGRAEL